MLRATGFDCEPLPNGDVLIEFFGDDGKTVNSQLVSPDVVKAMPLVASLTQIALEHGPDVARESMARLSRRPSLATREGVTKDGRAR
jgi:hypothetical protein